MGMDTENVELSPQEANFLLGERFKKNPFLWFKDGFFFFFVEVKFSVWLNMCHGALGKLFNLTVVC